MNRYFFDFDGVVDQHGITMPSADLACAEALRSMPEYLSELLWRGAARTRMTCTVREDGKPASYKIVLSLSIEDGDGEPTDEPFRLVAGLGR